MNCRYYLLAGAFRRWKTSTKSVATEQVHKNVAAHANCCYVL